MNTLADKKYDASGYKFNLEDGWKLFWPGCGLFLRDVLLPVLKPSSLFAPSLASCTLTEFNGVKVKMTNQISHVFF